MPANPHQKLKLLYVMQMLEEETDPEKGLTMTEIISKLDAMGVKAERKSIYRDIELLRDFGFDIQTYQRSPVQYALAHRQFSLSQLMLIVDAVESSKFMTQKQSDDIVRAVKLLASDREREMLNRRIHVEGRVKGRNDKVFANIDAIHEAMRQHRQVEFTYWKIGVDGKPYARHDGEVQKATPVRVSYGEERYYLTTWREDVGDYREYRIDRMQDLAMSDSPAYPRSRMPERENDPAKEDVARFGHFDGDRTVVTLKVDPEGVGIVVDRFGKLARLSDKGDGFAYATCPVEVSPQFFGWVAGMDGLVTIEKPANLADEYKDYLRKLIEG